MQKTKIKCKHCQHVYFIEENQACPDCGGRGGYLQSPAFIFKADIKYHLEETLEHEKSKNRFKIKEIQKNGFCTVLTRGPLAKGIENKNFYISFSDLSEYVRVR